MNHELRIMDRIKIALFCLFFFLILNSYFLIPAAYAHVLKTSGSVGTVIHIDPEDDPIVGVPSNFYFEFKDKNNTFKPQNCTCIASILEDGKDIYTQPLFQNDTNSSLTNASFSFTFPRRNIYTIKVVGTSTDSSFEPFTLTYDIRVERISESNSTNEQNNNFIATHYLHIIAAAIVVVFYIYAIIRMRKTKKMKSK